MSTPAVRILELDGLRALAVIAVVLYHLNVPGYRLGWLGVTIFFVLSGFLICGILIDSKGHPRYFQNFYVRRVLRIFPIYYLLITAVLVWTIIQGAPNGDWPYYVLYLQNFAMIGQGPEHANFPWAVHHTWSLAVEEQFYLLFPLVVYVLNRKQLVGLAISMLVAAPLSRVVVLAITHDPSTVNSLLPSQLDALGAGLGLALIVRSPVVRSRQLARWAALACAVALAGALFIVVRKDVAVFWDNALWGWGSATHITLTLFVLVFAAGMLFVLVCDSPVGAFLRLPWLRHIGEISYGIYLYHMPIYDAVHAVLPIGEPWEAILQLVLTYLVALASWRLIESPIRSLKARWAPQAISVSVAADPQTLRPTPLQSSSAADPSLPA